MKPEKLGKQAESLWNEVVEAADLDAAGLMILAEACRTLDIIERLTGFLRSKDAVWLRLSEEVEELADGAVEIRLVINPLLSEVRQQRMALRQLLQHLKLGVAKDKSAEQKTKSAFDKLVEDLTKD